MQNAERDEFEEQLAILCAGFNVPATTHRKHAYFAGLAKMSLLQLTRCVEHALGDEGPTELPTTKGIWAIHRAFRTSQRSTLAHSLAPEDDRDHLQFYANRMLLRHMVDRNSLGSTGSFTPGHGVKNCSASAELLAARNVIAETVAYFREPILEGDRDATPCEFITVLAQALDRVSKLQPKTLAAWREMAADPTSQVPFPAFMARELESRYRPQAQRSMALLAGA